MRATLLLSQSAYLLLLEYVISLPIISPEVLKGTPRESESSVVVPCLLCSFPGYHCVPEPKRDIFYVIPLCLLVRICPPAVARVRAFVINHQSAGPQRVSNTQEFVEEFGGCTASGQLLRSVVSRDIIVSRNPNDISFTLYLFASIADVFDRHRASWS